jgi:hypothetical protein
MKIDAYIYRGILYTIETNKNGSLTFKAENFLTQLKETYYFYKKSDAKKKFKFLINYYFFFDDNEKQLNKHLL